MRIMSLARVLFVTFIVLFSVARAEDNKPSAESPAPDFPKKLDPAHLKALAEAIGAKEGQTTGRVHTLSLPRTDLEVNTLELGEVPVEAGLASTLHVFRCSCGKY